MQDSDLVVLRNEANASPDRFTQWDPNRQFRREYYERHGRDPTYEEILHNAHANGRSVHEEPVAGATATHEEPLTSTMSRKVEEEEAPLSRQTTSSSTSSASSRSTAQGARLEEIRTARSTNTRPRGYTDSTQQSSGTILQRHPTERHPVALTRIETHRSQHAGTVGASQVPSRLSRTITRRKTEKPLPSIGAGKPFPPLLPDREEYVVEFDGHDDPLHAQNWPTKKKLTMGVMLAFDALSASMGSSIFSSATGPVAAQFGVGREVGTLGTSLFVFGYAFGPRKSSTSRCHMELLLTEYPVMWAPISELYGRRPPLVIAAFGFSIFTIAVAVAKDIQTVMICRFFAGLCGSSPLAIVAAVFADMFSNEVRGLAVAVFSATVFMGPLMAPFIGGFITQSYLGWRWTMYISSFMGFLTFGLLLFFLEETYPPVVLINKASELRRRTKNWGIHAKQEEIEVDFKELIIKNVSRPMRILFTEPIVLLITIYMSFIYGLLYLCKLLRPFTQTKCPLTPNSPDSIRSCLPRRLRLVPRRRWSRLLRHDNRRTHRLCRRRSDQPALRRKAQSQQQHPRPRMAAAHQYDRRCPVLRRPVLVRLDGLQRQCTLDCARLERLVHGLRHLQHLPELAELYR
jgi:DHA1 family multidrug resistance protein-like MFS transporter